MQLEDPEEKTEAQGTAKLNEAKVADKKDAGAVRLFGHEVEKKKAVGAGIALVCVLALIVFCFVSCSSGGTQEEPVVEKVEENAKANPNSDNEAVEDSAAEAEETASSGQAEASGATPAPSDDGDGGEPDGGSTSSQGSGSSSKNSGSGGSATSSGGSSNASSSNSSSSSSSHTHSWVYDEAVYETVHHDAVYTTVHHDAVYDTETVYHDAEYGVVVYCNGCGAQFNHVDEWAAHAESQLLAGPENDACGAYHTVRIVTKDAWTEEKQVLVSDAYDETIETQAAYDEQVLVSVAYYSCSCGATKS